MERAAGSPAPTDLTPAKIQMPRVWEKLWGGFWDPGRDPVPVCRARTFPPLVVNSSRALVTILGVRLFFLRSEGTP
jgi:hypothetical protein